MSQTLPSTRRSALPFALVVGAVLALFASIRVVLDSASGQRLDQRAMESVYAGPEARETLLSYLGYISIGTTALGLIICVAIALLQGKVRVALAALAVIAGANVTTQLLKHNLLDRPDFGYSTLNSLPSGHTTVVVSVVLAALIAAPPAIRPLFVFAGAFASTLTGASTVVGGWHRPGDIIAAIAVCLIWAAGVALVLGCRASRAGSAVTVLAFLGAGAAGAFLIAVGVRPTGGWAGFAQAASVLGTMGLAVAVAIAAFGRLEPDRHP